MNTRTMLRKKLPVRTHERLSKTIGTRDKVIIDGAERPILRSGDHETQEDDFSEKKKTLH